MSLQNLPTLKGLRNAHLGKPPLSHLQGWSPCGKNQHPEQPWGKPRSAPKPCRTNQCAGRQVHGRDPPGLRNASHQANLSPSPSQSHKRNGRVGTKVRQTGRLHANPGMSHAPNPSESFGQKALLKVVPQIDRGESHAGKGLNLVRNGHRNMGQSADRRRARLGQHGKLLHTEDSGARSPSPI